ncbi:MAG TPA: caspase family protein [Puia sp.]|nr:caspase family protein [Puia sp.]
MNRALLVGINNYPPPNQLNGCVNDVNDMANFLVNKCNFSSSDIRLVTDERATAKNILDRLGWLLNGVQKGDRILFHYSGHGAQIPDRTAQGDADRIDESICPVDFSFDDRSTQIRDKDFVRLFSTVPAGVDFVWVSDSCFSGGLTKGFATMPKGVTQYHVKTFQMPADIAWRKRTTIDKGLKPLTMKGVVKQVGAALISGCTEKQESADADIGGRYNGALTYFLLKSLEAKDGLKAPLTKLIKEIDTVIRENRFSQTPELLGSKAIEEKAFLAQ